MDNLNNGDRESPTYTCEEPDAECTEVTETKTNLSKSLQSKIGSDVTNFTLPVFLCEPTTTLQRLAEIAHFADLLNEAAELESALERLAYVSVFYMTGFNGTERFAKPFNPVLGETFEYSCPTTGVKIVAEQVSHHPPISACHIHNDKFVLSQTSTPRSIFQGNSIELDTQAQITVEFPRTGDRFSLTKCATTKVHNVLIGFAWIDHFGPVRIANLTTGDTATLHMEKCGFLDKNRHIIHGQIRDKTNAVHMEMSGKWTRTVSLKYLTAGHSKPPGTVAAVWSRPKGNACGKWKLTPFVSKLIEITPAHERLLPTTDSRLRPDRRLLAAGHPRRAGDQKTLIENRQRKDQKERDKGAMPQYVPKWFQVRSPLACALLRATHTTCSTSTLTIHCSRCRSLASRTRN
eukprot:TRINITY_DN163_c0_g3_i3.p1 TRINITY_DN163_c0_g3~~TRINITY_DN163_c0_g3_i3.p1  ORF type:complete len:405 (-),score=109.07 TRINITY_DN163_c0_g3_i3:139-1353(-)